MLKIYTLADICIKELEEKYPFEYRIIALKSQVHFAWEWVPDGASIQPSVITMYPQKLGRYSAKVYKFRCATRNKKCDFWLEPLSIHEIAQIHWNSLLHQLFLIQEEENWCDWMGEVKKGLEGERGLERGLKGLRKRGVWMEDEREKMAKLSSFSSHWITLIHPEIKQAIQPRFTPNLNLMWPEWIQLTDVHPFPSSPKRRLSH